MNDTAQEQNYKIFNRIGILAEGWYWTLASSKLKKGKTAAITLAGRELVLYRTQSGKVHALDAFCPHMGAHLAEGRVEGEEIRCFFHNWRFNKDGVCSEIPCLEQTMKLQVKTRSYPSQEKYNMIWIWTGDGAPKHDVPEVPTLKGEQMVVALGNTFIKNCHPNVVMINAIDEQHFRTVHRLPGEILSLESKILNESNILFYNTSCLPQHTWFTKFLSRFYKNSLTYSLSYWYGSLGFVSLGPDFQNLCLMFALRQTKEGKTEGQTILFTKKKRGPIGFLYNRLILFITQIAGLYFAIGDTRIFQTICFNFKTPIKADKSIIQFIKHLEAQPKVHWQ